MKKEQNEIMINQLFYIILIALGRLHEVNMKNHESETSLFSVP